MKCAQTLGFLHSLVVFPCFTASFHAVVVRDGVVQYYQAVSSVSVLRRCSVVREGCYKEQQLGAQFLEKT